MTLLQERGSASRNKRLKPQAMPLIRPEELEKTLSRVAPYSLEAERGLLAACIMDKESLSLCSEHKLPAEAFFDSKHRILFACLLELLHESIPIDEITLMDRLQRNGQLESVGSHAFINQLTDVIETTAHAQYWLTIVREKYLLRRLIRTSIETIERCYEQENSAEVFLEKVEQEIFQISQDRITQASQHIKIPVEQASIKITNLIDRKPTTHGLTSRFRDLDAMTFGFHPQDMIVLAARPSIGKTSLAMNFIEAIVLPQREGVEPTPSLIFSLEMSADQLAMRLLCSRAKVDMRQLRDGFCAKEKQSALARASSEFKKAPLWIDDSGSLTLYELRGKARRLHAKQKLGFIIIDYLQLISGTDSRISREQQIAEISRGIKALAKELNVPVMVLSQLNRDSEREKRNPRLSDLRESGAIEQDADVVFLLNHTQSKEKIGEKPFICKKCGYRQEPEKTQPSGDIEEIELIIAKQRNGPVGTITLGFLRRYTRFESYSNRPSQ